MRKAFKKTALYHHLEWSPLHRLFISINNSAYDAAQNTEMEFYRQFLRPKALVFDIGANNGSKSEVFLRMGARVVAVEPDSRCCQLLRNRFVFQRRFGLVPNAAGRTSGKLELFVDKPGSAYNTFSPKWRDLTHSRSCASAYVDVTTVDVMISDHGLPDFLKIDVEGFEYDVLLGLTMAVPIVSLEANLPTFREEALHCLERLFYLDANYRFHICENLSWNWRDTAWMTAAEAKRVVSERGEYCEIFAAIGV
jgi:FkbM family methyltransferase